MPPKRQLAATRATATSFPPLLTLDSNDHSLPYNDFLNSCTSLLNLKRIHARILTQGLSSRLALATKLVSLASLLSSTMDYARKLFDASPHRDSFLYNTLIRGYSDVGPCQQVPLLYKQMHQLGFSPDCFTFPFVVRSCAVLSAIHEGKQAHCCIVKNGFASNFYVQTSLVTMYSQGGEISDSEMVFGEMGFRNVFSWTAMIAGYVQNCIFGKAMDLFRSMVGAGIPPNEVTLVSVLPVCNGSDYLESGKSIHGLVIKSGFDWYVSLVNALIAMYGKCGNVELALSLFDGMAGRNLVSWNTMIAVYEQSGNGRKAIDLFQRMVAENVNFNSVTLVSVISACARLGELDTGRWVHDLARIKRLQADVRVGNALLDMYSKCGSLDLAQDIFDKLVWRGVVSWSAMIRAHATHGNAKEALELFTKMLVDGVKPNSFTFTSVLAACSHSGLVEEGLTHFKSMSKDYEITPTVEHCACLVDLLGRAGRLSEAYEFIKRMEVKPDMGVWGAFLGACRIHRNLQLAELVVEDLFRAEPHNVTLCVLMANMYADVGRWEDAARMRRLVKQQELKKMPGHSSVDTNKMWLS